MATYQEQIERRRLEREAKEKDAAERKALLSSDQVSNWRLVLLNMGIPLAMSMPESMVQQFRDNIQARINREFGDEGSR